MAGVGKFTPVVVKRGRGRPATRSFAVAIGIDLRALDEQLQGIPAVAQLAPAARTKLMAALEFVAARCLVSSPRSIPMNRFSKAQRAAFPNRKARRGARPKTELVELLVASALIWEQITGSSEPIRATTKRRGNTGERETTPVRLTRAVLTAAHKKQPTKRGQENTQRPYEASLRRQAKIATEMLEALRQLRFY